MEVFLADNLIIIVSRPCGCCCGHDQVGRLSAREEKLRKDKAFASCSNEQCYYHDEYCSGDRMGTQLCDGLYSPRCIVSNLVDKLLLDLCLIDCRVTHKVG